MPEFLHAPDPRIALFLYLLTLGAVIFAILVLAGILREPRRSGFGVYESGAAPGAPMRGQTAAPYFLIAVFFMIFDVEVAILFAWAIAAREVGRGGLIVAGVFIVVLLAALTYLRQDGALDTGPQKPAQKQTPKPLAQNRPEPTPRADIVQEDMT